MGMGGHSLGTVRVPVAELMQRRRIEQTYSVGDEGGRADLQVEWRPYF